MAHPAVTTAPTAVPAAIPMAPPIPRGQVSRTVSVLNAARTARVPCCQSFRQLS